jgi:ABC-2 type transport system ATP-binding protein
LKTKFVLPADDAETDRPEHFGMQNTNNTQTQATIVVDELTKQYGRITAVDELSFAVRPGAVTGFLGPNGAGKTTALKAIAGLSHPTSGRVLVNGTSVATLTPSVRALGVHIETSGAHPGRSARDHLRSLAALAGLTRSRVDEVLAIVGLEYAAGRRVGTFSLGMRQRLGLGSALLGDPEILVLDEPLNGLDPQGIRWLRTLLRSRAAGGYTVLLSSHVLTEAAQTVDDVVVINKGRLVRQGSIDDLGSASGVLVKTPTHERLAEAVARAGGRAEFDDQSGRVLIEDLDAAEVGELAHAERIVLHEIATRESSLEDVFFSLTEKEEL